MRAFLAARGFTLRAGGASTSSVMAVWSHYLDLVVFVFAPPFFSFVRKVTS
jgi:hypothetical protein